MNEAHIYIYGEIDAYQSEDGDRYGFISLLNVKSQYEAQKEAEKVVVHIHSVGGVVFEGFAIHDYLRSLGKPIETRVEGLCASISTVIALAGDTRIMTANSDYFIHNPWGLAMGDREQMQKYTDDLARLEDKLAKFYASKTKLTEEEALAFMKGETTFSADQALEKGFTTETAPALKAVAKFDPAKDFAKNENSNSKPKPAKMKNAKKPMDQKKAKSLLAKIEALFTSGEEVKAKIVQDANGQDIDFPDLEEDATPTVGDRAEIDGVAAEGEYVMPSYENQTFVFTAGELTEIKPAEDDEDAEDSEELAAANAEITRLQGELDAANAKALKAEGELAKAQKKVQTRDAKLATIEADVKLLKAEIGSDFEPSKANASKHKKAQDGNDPTARPQLFKSK